MGKVPADLRRNIAMNILRCRMEHYPGWGGSKRCAGDFGVPPRQWSQWERGVHMPNEFRMKELAAFFGVTIDFLRRDNGAPEDVPDAGKPPDESVCRVEAEALCFPEPDSQEIYRVQVTVERIH